MRLITSPSVYVVGRQAVDEEELDKFLSDHGVSWESDSEVAAEVLTETAGRLCFDEQTELLTENGWRLISTISESDSLATMNPENGQLEYQKPHAVHSYQYSGELLCVDGRDISFAVTPEHRQFASLGKKKGWGDFGFIPTEELVSRRFRILTAPKGWEGTVPGIVEMPGVEWSQSLRNGNGCDYGTRATTSKPMLFTGKEQVLALAELTAHYVANGSVGDQVGAGRHVVIYGRESSRVVELAKTLGLTTSVYIDKRNGCPRTVISGGLTLAKWFESECGRGFANKRFPNWVMSLPADSLSTLWDVMVRTDGHKYAAGGEITCSGSAIVAGQMQELLCKLGFSSSLSHCRGTNAMCWVVRKKIGRPAAKSGGDIVRKQYDGMVYCPTTANGIVFVRRNGKVHFSGNCYMSFAKPRPGGNSAYLGHIKEVGHGSVLEHAVWNLLITGVSRSLTHELVRHRAGISPSQLSQRYVDESVAEYVVPPDLQEEVKAADAYIGSHLESWVCAVAGQLVDHDPIDRAWIAVEKIASGDWEHPGDAAYHGLLWLRSAARSQDTYRQLSDYLAKKAASRGLEKTDARKFARQAARSVLPNATETKIFITANARALRHFIEQRASRFADPEIRLLATTVWERLASESSNLFSDYEKVPLADGTYELTTKYRKV